MRLLILIFISINTFAMEYKTKAIVRNKKFKAKEKEVVLKDLTSDKAYEGKYFKIVLGKNESAILLNHQDENLRLKASTTYYHLTKARNYFVENLKSEYVRNLPQMTIRLEIKNKFNELGHFANDNLDPQYNNALSIHESQGRNFLSKVHGEKKSGFVLKKVIKLKDLTKKPNVGSFKTLFKTFRRQTHIPSLNKFLSEYFVRDAYNGLTSTERLDTFVRTAGASIVLELLIWNGNFIEWLFTRKKFWLDSALVPEIIYHEYTHRP